MSRRSLDKTKKDRRPFIYFLACHLLPVVYRVIFGMKVKGLENIPADGPLIIAANHVTASDAVFIGCVTPRFIHCMGKASLFKNKLGGAFLKYVGAFPVERGSGGEDALQEAYDLLEAGRVVGIFPEGTRSHTGELLRPKTGVAVIASKTKAPVLPVSITSCDGGIPRFRGRMMLNFGKPIPIEELDIEEERSVYYRRGAKYIMSKISELREESLEIMRSEVKK